MMKTVRHNRKEIKHIENCTSQNAVKKQVKVNNYLFMDNQERFENVCLGYSIQAERLMKVIQKDTAGKFSHYGNNSISTAEIETGKRKISQAHQKFCLLSAVIKTIYQQITEDHSRSRCTDRNRGQA